VTGIRPSAPPVNVLLFWFYDDWGRFGRTYEKVASSLARLPEVDQVVCAFPPETAGAAGGNAGLRERRLSPRLTLLTERVRPPEAGLLGRVLRSPRWPSGRPLRAYLGARGFTARNTILWCFPPHPYIDRLRRAVPHRQLVTHVVDNFTHFDRTHDLYRFAHEQYPRIAGWSDVIFTNSAANHAEFRAADVPCHRVGQGVDEAFLATASELPCRRGGARPRVGYLGFIMARTDLALLAGVAAGRPDWDLVLAGPEYPPGQLAASGLLALPNVRWMGELPNREAPAFLQSLDVCVIPHRDTPYARSMRPLKLYQYLGSGRPVVSTPVDGLEEVAGHVHVAHDAAGFIGGIEHALAHDSLARAMARIDAVRKETWDVRTQEMLGIALQAWRRA
jgi:glycosyltransferase involved in cell wall biosynthesis